MLKKGYFGVITQSHAQAASEYLQGWRLHNFTAGQPVPVLGHSHSNKILPDVQTEFPVFKFIPIASCPDTAWYWKEAGYTLFATSLDLFILTDKMLA